MSSIWNLYDPLRSGFIKIPKSGREKFGTVIKSGFMRKTVTVQTDKIFEEAVYRYYRTKRTNHLVHDEDEICKTGDKVVIRNCSKISNRKSFYVKSHVWMVPRQNFTVDKFLNFEKRALLFNDRLRNSIDLKKFDLNDRV